ncbi:MAG: type II toxin-antitoxin system MqsA family antitoxin [Gammaproteobacteria bacterium]|nr:type II toxin-antitoxin system MqsA family antitoxin [Gammaproteobacteria bacterium]
MNCPNCGGGKFRREVRETPFTYRGKTIHVDQPGDWCTDCGEGVLSPEDMAATAIARHDAIAAAQGLLSCAEIRRIRHKLKLSQAEIGDILGGGINAFSRFERGEMMQPKSTDVALRLLDRHPNQLKEVMAA